MSGELFFEGFDEFWESQFKKWAAGFDARTWFRDGKWDADAIARDGLWEVYKKSFPDNKIGMTAVFVEYFDGNMALKLKDYLIAEHGFQFQAPSLVVTLSVSLLGRNEKRPYIERKWS